ncbi:class I SAM-dependent methyltransferase [Indiicoccus explosivorum]|uniref:class I SAM-dependent methyltransferase n=1 Tax=Indiicoccus explosivorum TaxID=1917864 RepID=UPI001F4D7B69|nr:class I SAM-dependent methyltransferase [Indiicoccus explosivorum]
MNGKKRFNPDNAHLLFSEERRASLPPEQVLRYLKVKREDEVADLGAGNGYFTIPLARLTDRVVQAVDIEPRMLAMLKENAEREQVGNIRFIESDLEALPLEDSSADKVLTTFAIHEVGDPEKMLQEIRRILKPGGMLLLTEWEEVEMREGPRKSQLIPSGKLLAAVSRSGFAAERIRLNSAQYALRAYVKNRGK